MGVKLGVADKKLDEIDDILEKAEQTINKNIQVSVDK